MQRNSRRVGHSILVLAIVVVTASTPARADESKPGIGVGAFVDTYYAYDFNRPRLIDRAFTTQPARHNEFNLNLAYIEAKLDRDRVHGRFALQAGTSVQSNYSAEPSVGSVSGPSLARNVQEAFVGYRLGGSTWIDAGVFFSHIGLESFISKDNPIYTRSLVADYSPYYQTGLRLSSKLSQKLSAQFLILNGWQNISESNPQKAFGAQFAFAFSKPFSITYNTFVGRESSFRHFHDLVLKWALSERTSIAAQADIGFQAESPGGRDACWDGFALIGRQSLQPSVALVARVERFADPKQVLIPSSNGSSFSAWSTSLGVDAALDAGLAWRNEFRMYWARGPVFTGDRGPTDSDAVAVSSLSVSL